METYQYIGQLIKLQASQKGFRIAHRCLVLFKIWCIRRYVTALYLQLSLCSSDDGWRDG